jgi:hypothetical protein
MLPVIPGALECVAALLLVTTPQDQDKRYVLNYTNRVSEGDRVEVSHEEKVASRVTIKQEGQPDKVTGEEKSLSLVAKCEVLSLKDDAPSQSRWTFSKAMRRVKGEEVPCWFQGTSFRVHRPPGAKLKITHENGSSILSTDLKELESALTELGQEVSSTPKDKPRVCIHNFLPSGPVKIGESWKPSGDVRDLVDDPDFKKCFDASKSDMQFTLKSVESKNGTSFATIEGEYKLLMLEIGAMNFDQAIPMNARFQMEFCIDGDSQDERVTMSMEFKGSSKAKIHGKPGFSVDVDIKGEAGMSRKNVGGRR